LKKIHSTTATPASPVPAPPLTLDEATRAVITASAMGLRRQLSVAYHQVIQWDKAEGLDGPHLSVRALTFAEDLERLSQAALHASKATAELARLADVSAKSEEIPF
jgi:hypothetical protein